MTSTTSRIGIIAGGAALLLAVVWYLALFQPESHHLKAAHAARAAAEAQVQTLSGQVAQLKALEKRIPEDKARLTVLKAAVPDNPSLPDSLGQLHNAASESGITLSSVSPTPPPVGAAAAGGAQQATALPSITLSLTSTGSYQQLMSFMVRLDNMARTVVVNTVSVSGGNSNNLLTANFTAEIFYAGSPNP